MKKILSLFIALILVFNITISASAAFGYMPGIRTFALPGASSLQLTQNETKSFDFYLPFDSESVSISYNADKVVTLDMNSTTSHETLELSADASETTYTFETVQRKGEFTLELTATEDISITDIVFNKAQVKRPASYIFNEINLSDNEKMLLSSVIIDQKASVILVRGGKRYINYENAAELPEIINGRVYLPAHTLARALGYYIEDYPERHYLLLRHERVEYCFTDVLSYKETYNGYDEPLRETIKNPLIYKNGKAYLPVREFAESLGKTVGFREGIIVIDDKHTVRDILSDNSLFEYIKYLLAPFYPGEKAEGNTYYVEQQNPVASDKNEGTQDAPFKTLAKAAEKAEAGDRVIIGSGTYREVLTPKNSGSATAPIVFEAAEKAEVIISALEEVTGFTENEGVYSAPLSWNLGKQRNQVFYNGKVLSEARYPNGEQIAVGSGEEPLDASWPVKGDLHLYTNPDSSKYIGSEYVVSSTLLNQEADYWKGGSFIGLFGHCYWLKGAEILASENGKLTIEAQGTTSFDNAEIYGSSQWGNWGWGYIIGHRNCMDSAGEWIVEEGQLSLIPPLDADKENLTVEVKKRQLTVDLSGKAHIQLKGVKTIGGSFLLNGSYMCVVNGCEILYNNHFLLDEDCDSANQLTDGPMSQGENGIYVSGSGNAFINNNIYEAAGAAIIGAGTYMYIENNDIRNCGYAGSSIGSLHFPAGPVSKINDLRGGHSIYSNTVARSGRSVMLHGGNTAGIFAYIPEEIAYNDFYDGFITALDAGITYDTFVNMGTEKVKTKYHNNYVYTTRPVTNPFSFGIYHDGAAEFIDTYNNVIFTTETGVRIETGGINPGDTAVYTQSADTSWADCDKWNNVSLTGVTGGPSALTSKDFPDERPFYAGAHRGDVYLKNYNKIVGGEASESATYFVKDAVLSENVSGNVAYLNEGQSISFEMDFGTASINSFVIGFVGDKYEDASSYALTIGENTYEFTLTSRAAKKDQLNLQSVLTKKVANNRATFQTYSGQQTVTITCIEGKGAGIVSIKPRKW